MAVFRAPKVGDLLDVVCHTSDRQLVRATVRADRVVHLGDGCWAVFSERPGGGEFPTLETHVPPPGRPCIHVGQFAPDGTHGFLGFADEAKGAA
jgi:hypothetical protein